MNDTKDKIKDMENFKQLMIDAETNLLLIKDGILSLYDEKDMQQAIQSERKRIWEEMNKAYKDMDISDDPLYPEYQEGSIVGFKWALDDLKKILDINDKS